MPNRLYRYVNTHTANRTKSKQLLLNLEKRYIGIPLTILATSVQEKNGIKIKSCQNT